MKGLRAAQQSLQGLGSKIASIGVGMTALGGAIIAPIAGAITHFVKFGSELNDLSERTGVAASSLAELKFAAEQSGASLGDVEVALKTMAKKGLGTDIDAQAARIAAIQDPAERAKAAIETFGKSGTKLLPMLANLKALREEAQGAGLVPSDEAVSVADKLGDAFDKVKSQAMAALFEIGAAVGPVLLPVLKIVSNIASAAIKWVKENQGIVRTVAAIGAGLVAAGTIVAGIGAAIFGLGAAFGVAASVLTTMASIAAAVVSPVGLIIGGLAAAAFAWLRFTESGRAAGKAVLDAVLPAIETVKATIGGIGDALIGGDLMLAAQIAGTGLKLVFTQAVNAIADMIGGTFGAALGDVGTRLIQGDLAGAWQTVVQGMAALWDLLAAGIVGAFAAAIDQIQSLWEGAIVRMQATLGVLQAGLGTLGLTTAAAGLEQINRGVGVAGNVGSAVIGAHSIAANSLKSGLETKAGQSGTDFISRVDGAASERERQLQAELDDLRKQAAAARAAADAAKTKGAGLPDLPDATEIKNRVAVGFSAAGLGLQLQGGSSDKQERIARAVEKANKKQDEVVAAVKGIKPAVWGP